MKDYRRILMIRLSSLGDIIHALPTLYAVRKNWPNAHITWAVHEQFSHILPGKPWIDEVIFIDKKRLKTVSYLWELWKDLHSRKFDLCLDLHCFAKSAAVALVSGAKDKFGYWELREGSFLVNKPLVGEHKYDHVIQRYLDTVRAMGGTVDAVEYPMVHDPIAVESVNGMLHEGQIDDSYVVLAPGARWELKEWPMEYWCALTRRFCDDGKKVVLVGSPDDRVKGCAIATAVEHPSILDLTGRTSIPELVEVIRGAACFVSADTGPLHIASALRIPLIALFGTTSAERTGPYGGTHAHTIISPTSQSTTEHPLVKDPDCMQHITVDMVWDTYKMIEGESYDRTES